MTMKVTVLVAIAMLAIVIPADAWTEDDTTASEAPGFEAHSQVRLATVTGNPDAFRSAPFHFVGQFHGFGQVFAPFYTVFESSRYLNLACWEDEAALWERDTYRNVYPLLYMARDRYGQIEKLLEFKRFDRFEATAIVRSSFKKRAWIELLEVKPLVEHLNPETIGNMIVAMRHRKARQFDLASLRFSEAYADGLPLFVRRTLRYAEGECLIEAQAYDAAVATLARAIEEFPNNRDLATLHQRAVALQKHGPARPTASAPQPVLPSGLDDVAPFSRLEGLQKISEDRVESAGDDSESSTKKQPPDPEAATEKKAPGETETPAGTGAAKDAAGKPAGESHKEQETGA